MKYSIATTALLCLLAAGCASAPPQPGAPEASVISSLGQPTNRYQDGSDRLLEYATGPFGQRTYMARIGPDGKLRSYEQVLTSPKFATIKVNQATKEDVLRTIGAPGDTSYLPLRQLEVWSYPYKQDNVWDSIMHVHFDKAGIVREMMNGPDYSRDPDSRLGMLFGR